MGKKNILHITRIIGIGGTEKMIHQICKATRNDFNRIILCATDGGGVSNLLKDIDRFYPILDMEKKNPVAFIKLLIKIRKIVKKENIDIIHIHHRMAAFYILFINLVLNKNVIYSAHTIHEDKQFLTRLILHNYPIIADGKKVYNNLVNFHKLNPDKIIVIYNTVDPFDGIIHENTILNHYRNEGYKLVGNVGRLCEQKGQKYFIEAAEIVLNTMPKTMFFIVGDGEDLVMLNNMVKDKNLNNYIYFMGFQNNIKSLIAQFDILVLSSLWEGLPLTPIEAFSVRKAVIASNIDGTDEIIEENTNGMFFDPLNVKEQAVKIIYALQHEKEWNEMSNNSLEIYNKQHSFKVFCERYRLIYKTIWKKG